MSSSLFPSARIFMFEGPDPNSRRSRNLFSRASIFISELPALTSEPSEIRIGTSHIRNAPLGKSYPTPPNPTPPTRPAPCSRSPRMGAVSRNGTQACCLPTRPSVEICRSSRRRSSRRPFRLVPSRIELNHFLSFRINKI